MECPRVVIEPASMESVLVLARADGATGCVFTCTHSPCVNLTLAVPSASFHPARPSPQPSSTIILIDPPLTPNEPSPRQFQLRFLPLPEQSISPPQRDPLGRPQVTSSVSVIHHYYLSYHLKYERRRVSLTATSTPCDIS